VIDDRARNWFFPNGFILQGLFLQRQSQVYYFILF
jgi:hypothetical protein